MKITVESPNQIRMTPETDHEKEGLDALWKAVIRCDTDSKVLCPVGSYLPSSDDSATFAIQDQHA